MNVYRSRSSLTHRTLRRSASEVGKFFPRSRFGLVWFRAGSGIATSMTVSGDRHAKAFPWFLVGPVVAAMVMGTHFGGPWAVAAEIRLRPECHCRRPVVTLGDVAEILATDARTASELAAIELFPAPSTHRQRFVRVRQIQDELYLRGINLVEHRFSGSSRVVLIGDAPEPEAAEPEAAEPEAAEPRPLSTVSADRAQRRVSRAVLDYLRRQGPNSDPWKVDVKLDENQARQMTAAGSSISVRGGTAPWVGPQRFQISIEGTAQPAAFEIDAEVSLPMAVVVAARPLSRGMLISAADVRLKPVEPTPGINQPFSSIDQVVGQETARAISEGKPLDSELVRPPLLVRRGDVVTVFARAPGIQVRTQARARDEGSLGELVAVESMLDRRRYFARVGGLREVEILIQAVQAKSLAEAGPTVNRASSVTKSLGGIW